MFQSARNKAIQLRDLTGCGKKKFKTELDKYLFRIPDKPLMPGYTIMRRSESNQSGNCGVCAGYLRRRLEIGLGALAQS